MVFGEMGISFATAVTSDAEAYERTVVSGRMGPDGWDETPGVQVTPPPPGMRWTEEVVTGPDGAVTSGRWEPVRTAAMNGHAVVEPAVVFGPTYGVLTPIHSGVRPTSGAVVTSAAVR